MVTGPSELWLATFYERPEEVRRLLGAGADPDRRGDNGGTALMEAVNYPQEFFNEENILIVRLLLDAGASVDAVDDDGWTALHHGAWPDVAAATMLLEAGADPTARAHDGTTPLHVAVDCYNVEVVRLLLERGADPSARSESMGTPIEIAGEQVAENERRGYHSDEMQLIYEMLCARSSLGEAGS